MYNNTTRLKGPFIPIDPRWWAAITTSFSKPWPPEAASADLRYHEMHLKIGRRSSMPSKRMLMSRWGWTDYQTRKLMRDEKTWSAWEKPEDITQKPPINHPESAQKPHSIGSDQRVSAHISPTNHPESATRVAHRSIDTKIDRSLKQHAGKEEYELLRSQDISKLISTVTSFDDLILQVEGLYKSDEPQRHWRPVAHPQWKGLRRDTVALCKSLWRSHHPPQMPEPQPQAEPHPEEVITHELWRASDARGLIDTLQALMVRYPERRGQVISSAQDAEEYYQQMGITPGDLQAILQEVSHG